MSVFGKWSFTGEFVGGTEISGRWVCTHHEAGWLYSHLPLVAACRSLSSFLPSDETCSPDVGQVCLSIGGKIPSSSPMFVLVTHTCSISLGLISLRLLEAMGMWNFS